MKPSPAKSASQTSLFDQAERDKLLAERAALERARDLASAECDDAHHAAEPYVIDYRGAHGHLVLLHTQRNAGTAVSKAEMLAAYDQRTIEAHRSWPYRKRVEDATKWQERVYREIRDLDERLQKLGVSAG